MESSTGEATAVECDIGKLLHLRKDLHNLHRDDKYRILKWEPNPHPSAYPCTRQYSSGPFHQFQPSWVVQYPWLHYSVFCDGVFAKHVPCLLQKRLEVMSICYTISWQMRHTTSTSERSMLQWRFKHGRGSVRLQCYNTRKSTSSSISSLCSTPFESCRSLCL